MRIPPGSTYWIVDHPKDHHLSWEHGRILDSLQIILITSGSGELQTRTLGHCELSAGSAFMIMPKVWHRYRPNSDTGWTESWVELRGPLIRKLIDNGMLVPNDLIRRQTQMGKVETTLEMIHRKASNIQRSDAELCALGMQILATWIDCPHNEPSSQIHRTVKEAERILTDRYSEQLDIQELARSLGVAYSHFRREFKAQTGYSPWKYVLHVRLSRVCRFLLSSEATLEDIASSVGFSSSSHLSAQFKKEYGLSPINWKEKIMKEAS
jgi:AraC-like DNA-binding protein